MSQPLASGKQDLPPVSGAEHNEGALDPQAYYDPSVYPNLQSYVGEDGNTYYYYYQPDDGNGATDEYDSEQNPMHEFYAAAAQGGTEQHAETVDTGVGGSPALQDVAATLVRTYEYEDYAPPSNGWMIDFINELFFSLFNRLYLTLLMWCAGALILTLSVSYSYATLYRMMDPPKNESNTFWQSMAYFCIFLTLSFVVVAVFCTWMDMLHGLWGSTRESTCFWGFSHPSLGKEKPPYMIYVVVMLATVVLPLMWAFIATIADGKSILNVASVFFYIATVVMMWVVAFCFVRFYWSALIEKRSAYARRFLSDDLREKRIVTNGHATKKVKSNWYYSESALEEYGLEKKSVEWSAPVFVFGLVPLFGILCGIARASRTDTPNNAWVAIGIIFISVLLLQFQMVSSKNHSHRTVFISLALILLLLVLGLIGCGVSSSGPMFALMFILSTASQFLLLRKRRHPLTRKEVCALLKIAIEREDEEERKEVRWDTYMCCCRNSILVLLQWLDIKAVFGYRHPKVREFEKRIIVEHPTLRCDYKVLLLWWMALFGCICFLLGIHNRMDTTYVQSIASATSVISTATSATLTNPRAICNVAFDSNFSKPLHVVDLAMLALIGRTIGDATDEMFAQWFYQYSSFIREYPTKVWSTRELLGTGNHVPFTVYHNTKTDFRVVVLQQQLFGSQMLQAVDYWGEEIALEVAGVIAPWLSSWSDKDKANFIKGAKFFKNALNQDMDPLDDAAAFIAACSSYETRNVMVVGDAYNGGYAKRLGKALGIRSVSFNAPGVSVMFDEDGVVPLTASQASLQQSVAIDLHSQILGQVGSHHNDVDVRFSLPCGDSTLSGMQCGSISRMVRQLLDACGDDYGRGISN
jgi:hypothetical protein